MKTTSASSRLQIPLLALVLTLLGACSTIEQPVVQDTSRLLSGEVFEAVDDGAGTSMITTGEILQLDDAMKAWVANKIKGAPSAESRLRRLVSGLLEDGLLNLQYNENVTYNARDTFYRRKGNCMSFSNLFVGLAREAGLNAKFQLVDVPPSFSEGNELIILNKHINVVIQKVRADYRFVSDHIVDFNMAEYDGDYDLQPVSDQHAFALYYSNLGVELLRQDKYFEAFVAFRYAIELDRSIPSLWVNLGALYSRMGHSELALEAYHQALAESPSSNSALVNLARLNSELGNAAEAARYEKLTDYYVRQNPYYFYEQARLAYNAEQYRDAIELLKKSIRLRRDEHQFYYLRAISYLALNNVEAARKNLRLAEQNSNRPFQTKRYQQKLGLLDKANSTHPEGDGP